MKGDISQTAADAIVNAANSELWMGSGVAGAINHVGGGEIELEAVAKGPIPVGEAVATSAGRLKARWVVHAAAMGPDLVTDERKIRDATRNALLRATELGARSIAFPALGTGVGGFPVDRSSRIMAEEMLSYAEGATRSMSILVVLYSDDAKRVFDETLEMLKEI